MGVTDLTVRPLAVRQRLDHRAAAARQRQLVGFAEAAGSRGVCVAQRPEDRFTGWNPTARVDLLKLAAGPPDAGAHHQAPAAATPTSAASPPAASPPRHRPGRRHARPGSSPWTNSRSRTPSISAEDSQHYAGRKGAVGAALAAGRRGKPRSSPSRFTVSLETKINDKGSLKLNGDVTPQPLAFNLSVKPSNMT